MRESIAKREKVRKNIFKRDERESKGVVKG